MCNPLQAIRNHIFSMCSTIVNSKLSKNSTIVVLGLCNNLKMIPKSNYKPKTFSYNYIVVHWEFFLENFYVNIVIRLWWVILLNYTSCNWYWYKEEDMLPPVNVNLVKLEKTNSYNYYPVRAKKTHCLYCSVFPEFFVFFHSSSSSLSLCSTYSAYPDKMTSKATVNLSYHSSALSLLWE